MRLKFWIEFKIDEKNYNVGICLLSNFQPFRNKENDIQNLELVVGMALKIFIRFSVVLSSKTSKR